MYKDFLTNKHTTMDNHRSRRWKMIEAIKDQISIPVNYYFPRHSGGRFAYWFNGREEVLTINNRLEGAEFLEKHGLIHTHAITQNGQVEMYLMLCLAADGEGEPVYWQKPRVVRWEDFRFSRIQALQFAAVAELEKEEAKYGIRAKVRTLFSKIKTAA